MKVKIYSHRGFLEKSKHILQENSLESFQNALENHFKAIEMDLWYLEDKFILSHDPPNQPKTKYNLLEEAFLKFGNKIYYWLDLKNINNDNISNATKKLKTLIDKYQIKQNKIIFVPYILEQNLDNMNFIYQEFRNHLGLKCKIGSVIRKIPENIFLDYYQQLKKHNIKVLSTQFHNINENFIKIFHDIEIFAWTVNKLKDLEKLQKLNIKNITSDSLTPKNT